MTQWQNIIGHEWAVELLAKAMEYGRIGHAYLLTGPEQIGKTTLARTFAQALNCTADGSKPCGMCRSCTLIAADRHPDVRLVLPEVSGRGKMTLKIDAIRSLQQQLSLATYEAKYKVAILKRFDSATDGAANAFLKTLEEPPTKVILILTANDSDTLLPTINSRCRTVGLRPLSTSLIAHSLQTRWQVPADKADLLAHLADGRLGWAVQAAKDASPLKERGENLSHLYAALGGNRAARFDLADKLTRKPELLPDTLRTWLSWWRDVLFLAQNGRNLTLTNVDERPKLTEFAPKITAEKALLCLQQTNQAIWQLERNANTRLVLENLFLIYPFG